MLYILLTIIATIATITWIITNPVSLAILILIIAISIALSFSIFLSSWVAFLLFLIYIGGILIIFAYFVATSPNAPINFKLPLTIGSITFIIIFIISHKLLPPYNFTQSTSLNTFYSTESYRTLFILALVLLWAIIVIVKVVSLPKGPLRPFNN